MEHLIDMLGRMSFIDRLVVLLVVWYVVTKAAAYFERLLRK